MSGDFMFTKICLKNFRSFDNIEFDLTNKNGSPKAVSIIYGENGAGKSNLISAFVLLNEILQTMDIRDAYEEFLSQSVFKNEEIGSEIRQRILSSIRDINAIINDYRMVGSTGNILAEYEFNIFGKTGKYIIEFGENEIVHERLEYTIHRRRGIYFDCTKESLSINNAIVNNKDFYLDIKSSVRKYWGKHSVFSIILHELHDKSESYGRENISVNFNDVIDAFRLVSCSLGIGSRQWSKLRAPYEVFENADAGEIAKRDEYQLDIAEKVLTQIFASINSSIQKVYYKRKYNDEKIDYQLYFEKMISGCYRNIPFSKESTGNHQILNVLCYLICACLGATIVIDEADSGIHDFLFLRIFQDIYPNICPEVGGQIILTTHNTLLMQAEFSRDATYIIRETENGSKEVRCISNYEKRTYINNNIRSKYLANDYGGMPTVKPIDFVKVLQEIRDA